MKRLIIIVISILSVLAQKGAAASERFTPLDARAGLLGVAEGSSPTKPGLEILAIKRVFDCFRIPYDTIEDIEDIFSYRVVYLAGPLHNSGLFGRKSAPYPSVTERDASTRR